MGKHEKKADEHQTNKSHKTLRDKLRKKRQQLKKHKKEKSQKKKEYDSAQRKKQFFQKGKTQKREDGIKENKLLKHLKQFVDIYQDDVEDFYDIFSTMDNGGAIDISDVADPEMQKCLKKIFKYLPLKRKKLEYKKKTKKDDRGNIKLEPLIKQLLSRVIEYYLENGTQSQVGSEESSDQQDQIGKKIDPVKQEQSSVKKQEGDRQGSDNQQLRQYQDMQLYGKNQQEEGDMIGPSIPHEQREMLAQMFEKQLDEGIHKKYEEEEERQRKEQENAQFDRIFAISSEKTKPKTAKASIDDIPTHLLAEGSALIGQKQQIDPEEIEEYNRAHRPRRLVDEHQEMMKLGKYTTEKNQRKPFDRERDIVYGRSRNMMNNGMFFDFKDKMTKPKSSNNFL